MRKSAQIKCASLVALSLAALTAGPALAAEPLLKFEPGARVILACDTQAVSVAPAAASSSGTIRIALTFVDEAASRRTGSWTILDVQADHTASLAARQRTACASGCEIEFAPLKTQWPDFVLWAPKPADPVALAANELLSVLALTSTTLAFSASTFLGTGITGLEKGTCRRE